MSEPSQERLILGKINGVYGVHGWVKVFSDTKPRVNIFEYQPWLVKLNGQWKTMKVIKSRPQGKGLVAQLESIDECEQAQRLVGAEIAVLKSQLPKPEKDEYYWSDLIGLEVLTLDGQSLGRLDSLFETGANDVMVVKGDRERLVPFIQGQYIKEIDLTTGVMRVDWDPEF